MQFELKNHRANAGLARAYADLFDGISPVKQRVIITVRDRILELKNAQTHAETRWHLDEMVEVAALRDDNGMTFGPDHDSPARLVVQEKDALRVLSQTGAPFPTLRIRGQGGRALLMAVVLFVAVVTGFVALSGWFANQYPGVVQELQAHLQDFDTELRDEIGSGDATNGGGSGLSLAPSRN